MTKQPGFPPFPSGSVNLEVSEELYVFLQCLLENNPWGVLFLCHNRQYRLLHGVPYFSGVFSFFQFPMGQHFHNILSHTDLHFVRLLLYIDNYQTNP